jgi:hypothetical protein
MPHQLGSAGLVVWGGTSVAGGPRFVLVVRVSIVSVPVTVVSIVLVPQGWRLFIDVVGVSVTSQLLESAT